MSIKDIEQKRKFSREWVAKRRNDFFGDKYCEWCGSTEKLELHHVDPSTKKASVVWSWTEEKRLKELEKCIILCKKCHHDYHNEKNKTWTHGIASTYKKGCRCQPCREAQYRTQRTKLRWYKPSTSATKYECQTEIRKD